MIGRRRFLGAASFGLIAASLASPELLAQDPRPKTRAKSKSKTPSKAKTPVDGEVLLAVAFTVRNGQLTYITNEGTKRSFPVSELDKQATQQMNDANGTSVSLPE